jgi:hypothetical protein
MHHLGAGFSEKLSGLRWRCASGATVTELYGTQVKLTAAGLVLLLAGFTLISGQEASKSKVSQNLSLLGFTLEKNTLADVQHRLGTTRPGSCSEDVEASKTVCYVADHSNDVRVLFESGSSGGWSRLDGFRVVSGDLPVDCHLQCKATTVFGKDIQTSGGLRLGLTREEVIALLGLPGKVNGNRLMFESWSKRPMTKSEIEREAETFKAPVTSPYWDVHDTVEVTLTDSKVTECQVRHSVTF